MRGALIAAIAVLALAGCPRPHMTRSYKEPQVAEVIAHLQAIRTRVPTLRAETRTDVRLGKDRANVTVLIMATWGGKLRFQALNPNDSMAADLGSDGATFCFIDVHHDCHACGPATPENVGQLVRIVMPPDDVVTFMAGGTPLIVHDQATVRWDDDDGHEVLELSSATHTQKIVLDGQDRRWDVLEAEVKTTDGKLVWRFRHKEFHAVGTVRMPGKSLFEQPGESVLIDWKKQELGVEIDQPRSWTLEIPPGLAECK